MIERVFYREGEKDELPEGSPYVLVPGMKVEPDDRGAVGRIVDAARFRHSGKAGHATRVMDALYKYPFLDRESLHCVLLGRDGEEFSGSALWDALCLLRDCGIVTRLTYAGNSFYALSPDARKSLSADMRYGVAVPPTDAGDAEILSLAGLCRWHAHAAAGGNVGINGIRQQMRIAGCDYLPDSYMEFSRSIRYRLFAYPVPRDDSYGDLCERLLFSWRLQKASIRKGQASITLLVAPSLSHALSCAEHLSENKSMSGKTIYYGLESRFGPHARGLGGICRLDPDEGTLTSIGLK